MIKNAISADGAAAPAPITEPSPHPAEIPAVLSPPGSGVGTWTPARWDAFYAGLQQLVDDCGPNKHDQVAALIVACIDEGINTMGHIIGVLQRMGFNRRHVAISLKKAEAGLWQRDAEGIFILPAE